MSNIKESYVYVESKTQDQTCIGIKGGKFAGVIYKYGNCLLYTSPSPRDSDSSRMPSSA